MTDTLMTDDDLVKVTGRKRYSKQATWFKDTFGVDVARAHDGPIVITWSLYNDLLAHKAGFRATAARPPAEICSPFA